MSKSPYLYECICFKYLEAFCPFSMRFGKISPPIFHFEERSYGNTGHV